MTKFEMDSAKVPIAEQGQHRSVRNEGTLEGLFSLLVRSFPQRCSLQDAEQSISHICAVRELDPKVVLRSLSALPECRAWPIDAHYMTGVYASHGDYSALIFAPTRVFEGLGDTAFDQSIDAQLGVDLEACAQRANIPSLYKINLKTFLALIWGHVCGLSFIFAVSPEEVDQHKFRNSHRVLLSNYEKISRNVPIPDGRHLSFFSFIYYWEVQILKEVLGSVRAMSINDVGTNSGHFPLFLCALESEKSNGMEFSRIIASDIHVDHVAANIDQFAARHSAKFKKIEVHQGDVLQGLKDVPDTDIVVANDLLEHLEEHESFLAFCNLWNKTRRMLLIHVPLELVPERKYGHCTAFTAQKLAQWGTQLDGSLDVTPGFLRGQGHLYLQRVSPTQC